MLSRWRLLAHLGGAGALVVSAGVVASIEGITALGTAAATTVKTSAVPLGTAYAFKHGVTPAYLVQPTKGTFAAFPRICTHAGCTIGFSSASKAFVCPCHGSVFSPKTAPSCVGQRRLRSHGSR